MMTPAIAKALEKEREVIALRESGETFDAIGRRFLLSVERIRQIYWRGVDRSNKVPGTIKGDLSVRARNCIRLAAIERGLIQNDDLVHDWNRETVRAMHVRNWLKVKNCGQTTALEIEAWLGPSTCPLCGSSARQ